MATDLIQKLHELQGVLARGGIARLTDSDTIRQAIEAIQQVEACKLELSLKEQTHLAVVRRLQGEIDRLKSKGEKDRAYAAWATSELSRQAEERNSAYQCGEL